MFGATGNIQDVARLIQLAVAPIFLLTAVATTLMVLAGRLARIVDRGRSVESRAAHDPAAQREELLLIQRRAHIIYRALFLGVFAAILVCLLMTTAFLGEVLRLNVATSVILCFIAALFCYTGALLCLLREVSLAIGTFRLGVHPPPAAK